jgi:hypothetical protein
MEKIQQPQLTNQLMLNHESIKSAGSTPFVMKASAQMLESTNLTGTEYNPQSVGITPIKDEYVNTILDMLPKVLVSSPNVVVSNEVDEDGAADIVSEGGAKPQIDFDINVSKPVINKYASHVKVSEEMLADIPFMESQIRGVLMRRLKNTISTAFMNDLVGVTPTYDSSYLTSGTTGTLVKDILPAVTADMQNLGGYTLNLWMLNQPDYAKLFVEAGTNFLWYALNEPKIVNNSSVYAGSIVGIDTTMFPLYVLKDMEISFGRTGTDLTDNKITIRCESRIGWNLVGNSLSALYNDTIANTLTAIA